jgi:hypothetical protein
MANLVTQRECLGKQGTLSFFDAWYMHPRRQARLLRKSRARLPGLLDSIVKLKTRAKFPISEVPAVIWAGPGSESSGFGLESSLN